jgi:formylglycine-generating enzyme required for sulfatase activity
VAKLIIRKRQEQAQYFTEDLGNGITMDMILIPAGTFFMGSPETEIDRRKNESPQHKVNVSSFFMGKYPVTQAQWKAIAEQTDLKVKEYLKPEPSSFKEDYEETNDRWNRPVEQVNWYQAKEFCARLRKKNNREYRLPTEAEWEYACRAVKSEELSANGEQLTVEQWNKKYHQPFHFGESITTNLANYRGTDWKIDDEVYPENYGRGSKGEYREQTTPVGYFKVANAFGLYDMHGNVWEWCEDDYHDSYGGEDRPNDGTAWLSKDVKYKVLRGGSYSDNPYGCRSASRDCDIPRGLIDNDIGFRVVCVLPRTY